MEWLINGTTGFVLTDLAFVSALVASVAYFDQLSGRPQVRPGIGTWAFRVHAFSVLGILATILLLLGTHRYEYHYVWSHSSNELPLHFIISCLWEGQEGSFLTWMVWHAVLGLIVQATAPQAWKAGVMAVISSIQILLATMILGVQLQQTTLEIVIAAATAGILALLAPTMLGKEPEKRESRVVWGSLMLLTAVLWLNMTRSQTGFLTGGNLTTPAFLLEAVFLAVVTGLFLRWVWRSRPALSTGLLGALLLLVAWGAGFAEVGALKLGSSPFVLLRDAFPDEEIFRTNPDFVPANGRGLNSLLQNYWMVIHPPTLFLGFALTLVPFAFVLTGLVKRDYAGWIKPAAPWMIASTAILGVGIIMGGYWAYETLNFGGYWNWDPVENASLVPWLTAVASLHVGLAYRHGKAHLRSAMLLVIATFLLVLYSTFLTRSGILGDASVHSFTDLGLSGQLLTLLMVYVVFISLLMAYRWTDLPETGEKPFWSREMFLFLAALTLTFSAAMISVVTSLPVFNKIFGSNLAPTGKIQLFYYKWNVWFGIGIALLSALGQFVFWTKIERETFLKALYRPFAAAALASVIVILGLWVTGWEFAYRKPFQLAGQALLEKGGVGSWLSFAGYALLQVADELLLFASVFTVLANLDILVMLVRRAGGGKRIGGSLAHIGFGLMLLGILFSSGYESTVSLNFSPGDLGEAFDEESKRDNVLLVRNKPKYVAGYQVTYLGKRQAEAPIEELAVVSEEAQGLKVAFDDATGERYALEVPWEFFRMPAGAALLAKPLEPNGKPEPDLTKLHKFVEDNLAIIQPKMINGRSKYLLEFLPLDGETKQADTSRRFVLQPEAEVSERMGLVLHPDREIWLGRDLYTYVSSIPKEEADTAARKVETTDLRLAKGDSAQLERGMVYLDDIVKVDGLQEYAGADAVLRAKLRVVAGGITYTPSPMLVVKGHDAQHVDASLEKLGLSLSFEGIAQGANGFQLVLRASQVVEPDDFITFKAIHKPYINFLWLGTFVMTFGFAVAIYRRVREERLGQPSEPLS